MKRPPRDPTIRDAAGFTVICHDAAQYPHDPVTIRRTITAQGGELTVFRLDIELDPKGVKELADELLRCLLQIQQDRLPESVGAAVDQMKHGPCP